MNPMKTWLNTILMILFIGLMAQTFAIDNWTYVQVDTSRQKWGDFDEPEWLRYFGLSCQDVNYDALIDVVSGRYVYLNPGGELIGPWKRVDLGMNVDAMLSLDVDGDGDLDILQKDFNHQRRIAVWLNNGPAVKEGEVRIADVGRYRTGPHFKVVTNNATFYIEKSSGGITSMFDRNGNDWVDYNKTFGGRFPQSAAGDFRGIPNMVYGQQLDSGTGHPGFETIKSADRVGDNKLHFVSNNGYEFSWTFTDDYAKLDVEKVIPGQSYWILYEGPVGGEYNMKTTYWGTDEGMRDDVPDYLNGERVEGHWQWAYFGSKNQDRVFVIKQQEPDELADMLGFLGAGGDHLESHDGMVVFGLGRSLDTKSLFTTPQTFYFGFYEKKIDDARDYEKLKDAVRNMGADD